MKFKLLRFNPRRASRGVGAAEIEIVEGGATTEWTTRLWMDEKDIEQNITIYGRGDTFVKALEHYKTREKFPAKETKGSGL